MPTEEIIKEKKVGTSVNKNGKKRGKKRERPMEKFILDKIKRIRTWQKENKLESIRIGEWREKMVKKALKKLRNEGKISKFWKTSPEEDILEGIDFITEYYSSKKDKICRLPISVTGPNWIREHTKKLRQKGKEGNAIKIVIVRTPRLPRASRPSSKRKESIAIDSIASEIELFLK